MSLHLDRLKLVRRAFLKTRWHIMFTISIAFACHVSIVASEDAINSASTLEKLNSSQPSEVRIKALQRIQGTRKEDAVRFTRSLLIPIEAACADENAKVREAAVHAYAVICLHREMICPQVLMDRLGDDDQTVRNAASTYVPILKHTEASAMRLLPWFESSDRRVRSAVVSTLITLKSDKPRVVELLQKATDDAYFGVVHNAHIGLYETTGELEPLIRYAVAGIEEHASYIQKEDAGELTDEESLDSAYRELLAFTCASIVRREGKKRPKAVAKIVISMLKDPSPIVRRSAARNLGAISTASRKTKKALQEMKADKFLEPLLSDPDESVRQNAAYGQALIREPKPRDIDTDEPKQHVPDDHECDATKCGDESRTTL